MQKRLNDIAHSLLWHIKLQKPF